MATREIWNYNEDGTISKEVEQYDDILIDIDAQIQQQEEQLLSMYEELERLKALKNQ